MKYITLIIGLLVVGCGKTEQTKELSLRDSVVGEYKDVDTFRFVFLDNGIVEIYEPGDDGFNWKLGEPKWKIVNKRIHIINNSGIIMVYRINKDGSITLIADIEDGKRTDYPKEMQLTFIKIK